MRTPSILLTGFEPFAGMGINPSWEVAKALHGSSLAGAQVRAACLPCRFGESLDVLAQALAQHQPRLVLCLGLADNRDELSLERVAVNLDDASIPDNAGAQPIDQPVVAGGPAAYFTRLPIKAIVQDLRAAGLPAGVSHSAGSFVCNHAFYGLMHLLRRRRSVRAGFMHVPSLPGQDDSARGRRSGLALTSQIQGVQRALQLALTVSTDLVATQGTLD